MSFIAQDFEKLDIITVLEGRTQAIIRNHFLRYDRAVSLSSENHYDGYV
ncbi:50S ribosomal protein L1 [Streptococcus pneumoniae GA47522]|nr:50S ribosomal protein L1 [Streptococcus pneumoniae GA47522]